MRDLAGRTAILTGAVGGIGPFIARELAKEQINLVLAARSGDEIESLVSELHGLKIKAVAVETDVRDFGSLQGLVTSANREFGSIDILINNAGVNNVLSYHRLHSSDVERIMRTNLIAPMLLTWLVLPGMLERRRGHVVNMSSLAGEVGTPFCEPYGASKAGLIGFTESFRMEYRGLGISSSVICPGFVTAGQYQKLVEETGLEAPKIVGTSHPKSVARAVLKAIKHDVGHILVNPIRTKLFVKTAKVSPLMGEWLMSMLGVVTWLKKVAEIRELKGLLRDTRP
jgi:short-subunit dehydrogenase